MRDNRIEPILFKGAACARYYPPAATRDSLDVDLAVSQEDYHRAKQLIGSRSLAVDLHCELRRLDPLRWHNLVASSRTVEIGGERIRVLAPEDHIRVISTHWLIDGGRYKHRLWDIYYILNGERSSLDWDRLLEMVPKHRRRWVDCVAGCAERYLDLDLTDTPLAGAAARLPQWFVATLEREWQLPDLKAMIYSSSSISELWPQVKRRIAPNPITATVMMNGSLDAPTRFFYRVGNLVQRIPDSVKRAVWRRPI